MSLLIALGYAAGHGKDTAAAHIIKHRSDRFTIKRYAFADLLKCEIYDALCNRLDPFWAFLDRTGDEYFFDSFALPKPFAFAAPLTDEQKCAWINANKEPLRHILQVYGTEYRRNADPFYWVRALGLKINEAPPQVALITDMRFLNETFFVKANDGFTIKVVRVGYDNGVSNHISEQQLAPYEFDYTIEASTIAELEADALQVFDDIIARVTPNDMSTSDFTEEAFLATSNQ